jgi:apolipoprotein N-acyltransferase
MAPETALPGRGSISETAFEKSLLLNNIKEFLTKHPGSVFATGISSHRFYYNPADLPKEAYQINREFG